MSAEDRAYEIGTADRLIALIANGDAGADVTRDYKTLNEILDDYVQSYGGKHKGELTIKIAFEADAKGVDVAVESRISRPKRPRFKERLFSTGRGTLTAKDPAKNSLFPGANLGRRVVLEDSAREAAAKESNHG